ncbi:MAG TPA: hypothetical protein VMZ04_06420 [Anaerolineae bacterium]|nr:hypothetical protein [Anaerolineae bacterium]
MVRIYARYKGGKLESFISKRENQWIKSKSLRDRGYLIYDIKPVKEANDNAR